MLRATTMGRSFALVSLVAMAACTGELEEVGVEEGRLGAKVPSNADRALRCPIASTDGDGFAPSTAAPIWDESALTNVVASDVKTTVILIRRVNGVPVYRYLSNGTAEDVFQPWSSTKFLAAVGATAKLRRESEGRVGLTGRVGDLPLGDFVTVIASYRSNPKGYTSNGLTRYLLNIAGRPEVAALVHDWLGRPATESYGGNYGEQEPDDLGYTIADGAHSVTVTPDDRDGIPNALSSHTLAEAMKRLAVWDDERTRHPDLARADLETLFYGPTNPQWSSGPWGGLSADVSTAIDNALDLGKVERESKGRWRLFGKVGWGSNVVRGHERVNVSYACLPVLDASGNPVPNKGAEFVLATKVVTKTSESDATAAASTAIRKIVAEVLRRAQ